MKISTNMAHIYNTIQYNAISKLSCKFGESKWNPYWVIVLTSSSGTNYVPNECDDIDQYDPYAIPSEIKLFCKLKMKSLLSYCVNELIWH